jgi:thiamine-phosphate diphosphorylase
LDGKKEGKLMAARELDLSLYFLLNLPYGGDIVALVEEVISGGVTTIQVRGKELSGGELYAIASRLRPVLSTRGVGLIMNDRLDVAMAVEADGVHVGRDDLPVDVAKRLAPGLVVGASCYGDVQRAKEMAGLGADYLAFGSCFASPSKPQAPQISLDVFGKAKELGRPLVAIGGICPEHVPVLREAGADGVAVISAIQQADKPMEAARAFVQAWKR